jgi:hypothetical protein
MAERHFGHNRGYQRNFGPERGREHGPEYGRERGSDWERQRERQQNDEWAREVPERRFRGPYDDYGWEEGDSILPEFRDPSVHEMPWDEPRRDRQGRPMNYSQQGREHERDRFREAYDYRESGRYNPAERGYESGHDLAGRYGWEQERDRGAPGLYAGKGPRGYQRSNERIYEDVAERLTAHGEIDASDIAIHVENGEVTLTGQVEDRHAKRLAEDITESVTGVRDVHNQLRLGPGGHNPSNNPGA